MESYYDDNFGHWEDMDEDAIAYYHHVQDTNVEKKCNRCGQMVKIQPPYAICDYCATRIDQGFDDY